MFRTRLYYPRKLNFMKFEVQDLRLRDLILNADWTIRKLRTCKTDFPPWQVNISIFASKRLADILLGAVWAWAQESQFLKTRYPRSLKTHLHKTKTPEKNETVELFITRE